MQCNCIVKYQTTKCIFSVIVPDIVLPMDDIQGTVLQGTIVGTVYGGANIVPGRVGGALRLNGVDQNVKFRSHPSACYHAFQDCPHGVTWAMWLKLDGQQNSVILDTGGCHGAAGYKLLRYSNGVFRIRVKNTTYTHDIELEYWELGYWVHLMFSLHPTTGGALYLNGCRVTGTAYRYHVYAESRDVNGHVPVVLGSKLCDRKYSAMDIDSLHIWYDILTPEDVWKFYLHGGAFTFWWNRHMQRFLSVSPSIHHISSFCLPFRIDTHLEIRWFDHQDETEGIKLSILT